MERSSSCEGGSIAKRHAVLAVIGTADQNTAFTIDHHRLAAAMRWDRGFDAVMEDVIKEANDGPEYMYISFDIDTFDPAFVPGTGTPTLPSGASMPTVKQLGPTSVSP